MEANITPTKIRCINRWFLKTKWLVSTCQWNKRKSKTTSLLDPTILCVFFQHLTQHNAYGNSHLQPNWRVLFGWSAESAMGGHSSKVLLPAFLGAIRALVLLYLIRFRRCYSHTLAVEPPLTNVTSDPELIRVVQTAASATEGFAVFFVVLIPIFNSCGSWVLYLAITWSLHNKVK